MNRTRTLPLAIASMAALLIPTALAQAAPTRDANANIIEGRYIVVYNDVVADVDAATDARARQLGFTTSHRYRSAVEGFAAALSAHQVDVLRKDEAVRFVTPDRRVKASASVGYVPGEPLAPTGVRRILSATTTTVREASGVNVAVIDTGITLGHPDLNAAAGTNCVTPAAAPEDDNGHGTHVAGSIGAKNNGAGVVGVAPGTRTYAVKVLDAFGSGTWAGVICGIDWVKNNSAALNIKVANMSLGGGGSAIAPCATTTDAMHVAICNATASGVNFVVAAGNSGWDFDFASNPDVPAAYPQVLTTTSISDSNGTSGGGGGAPACDAGQGDDVNSTFSNFAWTAAGTAHTIAAPGSCIKSTWLANGYNTISGTSMASPHMAGVVALCIKEVAVTGPCTGMTTAQVITHMRTDAQNYNTAVPGYGFTNDPTPPPAGGEYYGFLTRVPPAAAITANAYVSAGKLLFRASAAATDTVVISTIAGPKYRVTNTTAPVVPGPGCVVVNPNVVDCSTAGVTAVDADLKDLNDKITVSSSLPSVLLGGTGNDQITGGPLNDTIDGGTGADIMAGGAGTDTVTYATRTAAQPVTVTINNVANDGQAGELDNVQTTVESLIGGAGNDTLEGSGFANRLDGRGGADVMRGLAGTDTVTYATRVASVFANIDGVANDGQTGEGDNIATDVEDLVGGSGNDTLKAIAVNAIVNVLSGGPGNDQLKTRDTTGTGDRIFCGTGADIFDRDAADMEDADCETPGLIA